MSRLARLVGLLLLAVTDAAVPEVKHPYLQTMTDSTVKVCWQTSASRTGKVEYGLTSSYGMEVSQPGYAVDHELALVGLQMDTLYRYRVISGTDTSADATFRTNVTGNRPFRFFAYGDNRSDRAAHQRVVNRMLLTSPMPALALNIGDLAYEGSLPDYETFFDVERGLVSRLPMYPSLGNHDIRNMTNWFRFLDLPNNERWYTVRYGNSVFHCLDNYSNYAPGSPQYDWLVSELQSDSANPSTSHIFVWFHDPPYTTSAAHSSDMAVRQYLCPLFERFLVAIVFLGHVHGYEHSLVNGVHYIISGGGGAPRLTRWNAAQPWTVYREATYQTVVVDVNRDTIRSVGIRLDGTEFDPLLLVQHTGAVERR
jgi:hypothetical protein